MSRASGVTPVASQTVIRVAAGVLRDAAGRVLIARRPDHAHGGGFWEFPGGKLAAGESPEDGLIRELKEELAIDVRSAAPLMVLRHDYPDRLIELHVWTVAAWSGEPRGVEGQPLKWVAPEELPAADLLPADRPIVDRLLAERVPADRLRRPS